MHGILVQTSEYGGIFAIAAKQRSVSQPRKETQPTPMQTEAGVSSARREQLQQQFLILQKQANDVYPRLKVIQRSLMLTARILKGRGLDP